MTQFYVDRGGTFTDIVTVSQDPALTQHCQRDPRCSVFTVVTGETALTFRLSGLKQCNPLKFD